MNLLDDNQHFSWRSSIFLGLCQCNKSHLVLHCGSLFPLVFGDVIMDAATTDISAPETYIFVLFG